MKKRPKPEKRDVSMKPPRPTAPPPPAVQPIPLELRPIESMPFGFNMCKVDPTLPPMASKTWEAPPEQIEEQAWVRGYLKAMGCVVASDIEKLGCTGVAEAARGYAGTGSTAPKREEWVPQLFAAATRLRLGLAGSGVGLPCFVPPSRFCLVHNTIGGLEDGQTQHHADLVELVSRPLTPEEEAKTRVMQHARRLKSVGEVNEFIAGKSPIDGDEPVVVEEGEQEELPATVPAAPAWKCTDHKETVWTCRYCLAQMIVEGPLEPKVATLARFPETDASPGGTFQSAMFGPNVAAALKQAEEDVSPGLYVIVQAAHFTRKLARD